jgi:hypothetical protein
MELRTLRNKFWMFPNSVGLKRTYTVAHLGLAEKWLICCVCIYSNPILFAVCTNKLTKRIQWHVEECLVALFCN